ncbi:MAG: DUF1638 domain-containing protein [Pseudomonadota bacterium]
MELPPQVRVLACRVFAHELAHLGLPEDSVTFLEQGLHRYPDELRRQVGAALAAWEDDPAVETVVLVYGFCGGGLEGLKSRRLNLALPLAHDCIPLLLGHMPRPRPGQGGSFYLSPGWVDHAKTPFTEYQETARRWDEETAQWVGREMLKSYCEVVMIETDDLVQPHHRAYAQGMAGLFGLGLRGQAGDLSWLRRLLALRPGPGLLLLSPGQVLDLAAYPQADPLVQAGEAPCP